MIKFLFIMSIATGLVLFNGLLSFAKEGVNYYSVSDASGWKTICKYYTPVRLFEIHVDVGHKCPSRVVVK